MYVSSHSFRFHTKVPSLVDTHSSFSLKKIPLDHECEDVIDKDLSTSFAFLLAKKR